MNSVYVLVSMCMSVFSVLITLFVALLIVRSTRVAVRVEDWTRKLLLGGFLILAMRHVIVFFGLLGFDPGDPPGIQESWYGEMLLLIASVFLLAGVVLIGSGSPLSHTASPASTETPGNYDWLFDHSRDPVMVVHNGRIIHWNKAMSDLFEYAGEELRGMEVRELFYSERDMDEFLEKLAEYGSTGDHETTLYTKSQNTVECLVRAASLREAGGGVSAYQAIVWDVTGSRQMERALIENNRILSAVLNASPVGICLVRDRMFEWVNDAMARMLGYEKSSLQGKHTRILYPDYSEYDRVGKALYDDSEDSGDVRKVVSQHARQDGTLIYCLLQASPLSREDPDEGTIISALDITELKLKEEALKESEERYRRFFEEDLAGAFISTAEGRLLSCNPAFVRIFGFSSVEEAIRYDLHLLYPDRMQRERFLDLVRSKGKLEYHRSELRRRDGKTVHVVENATGIFDNEGRLVAIKGYLLDATDQMNLEEQLRQSQKMEAIGRLAGGIAHDFNNLLTAITGHAEFLLKNPDNADALRRNAEEIRKAAARAASLTSQLLAFSRKQLLQPQVLDLNEVISEMEGMLRRLIREDIQLVISLHPELGRVRADKGQIGQVILNLAVNARDAMPEGGRLIIETADIELDKTYVWRHITVPPGYYVMLAISDSGLGMDEETLSHLFEPFFTTKETARGTGLGLATVYGIVKQSEGHIWVYSEPGGGTTFKVYLPRVEDDAVIVESPPIESDMVITGSETILLVEDDDVVRNIICESLRSSGYNVLEACHGAEALKVYREYTGTIDLLVTDVVMPGMNGRELAERLTGPHPDIKVLYMSGYTDRGIVHDGILDPGTDFLQKPFGLDALSRKIREVLG